MPPRREKPNPKERARPPEFPECGRRGNRAASRLVFPPAFREIDDMETKPQDAIALLKADHRTVEELFAKFEKASGDGRKQKLAEEICLELSVHAAIEEEIFYPACEGKVDEDLLKEAYVEHDGAKVLIAEIEAGGPSDEYYDAKVKVLQEQIEHHVEEEEKRMEGMFAQARKAGLDMEALGEQLLRRKEMLTTEYKASGTPTPELTTMTEAQV
jgi:hemerythrin superfamily protein